MTVICLTATPYDGSADGVQKKVINELGYCIYKNSDRAEDYEPKDVKEVQLGTLDKIRAWILKESDRCGVLVYANDELYE